jgi:hypothetical protein
MKTYCNCCLEKRATQIIEHGDEEIFCCADCLPELGETAARKGWNIIVSPIVSETQADLFN